MHEEICFKTLESGPVLLSLFWETCFSQAPKEKKKKKVIWNVFHSMSHTRLQQINKPGCLAAETLRNINHQSSDDDNGTKGMLNLTGWYVDMQERL